MKKQEIMMVIKNERTKTMNEVMQIENKNETQDFSMEE